MRCIQSCLREFNILESLNILVNVYMPGIVSEMSIVFLVQLVQIGLSDLVICRYQYYKKKKDTTSIYDRHNFLGYIKIFSGISGVSDKNSLHFLYILFLHYILLLSSFLLSVFTFHLASLMTCKSFSSSNDAFFLQFSKNDCDLITSSHYFM